MITIKKNFVSLVKEKADLPKAPDPPTMSKRTRKKEIILPSKEDIITKIRSCVDNMHHVLYANISYMSGWS